MEKLAKNPCPPGKLRNSRIRLFLGRFFSMLFLPPPPFRRNQLTFRPPFSPHPSLSAVPGYQPSRLPNQKFRNRGLAARSSLLKFPPFQPPRRKTEPARIDRRMAFESFLHNRKMVSFVFWGFGLAGGVRWAPLKQRTFPFPDQRRKADCPYWRGLFAAQLVFFLVPKTWKRRDREKKIARSGDRARPPPPPPKQARFLFPPFCSLEQTMSCAFRRGKIFACPFCAQ